MPTSTTTNAHTPRISIDPAVLSGKPTIHGTRISVELILDHLSRGWTHQQILDQYPHLSPPDILACLAYASQILKSERVYPIPAIPA